MPFPLASLHRRPHLRWSNARRNNRIFIWLKLQGGAAVLVWQEKIPSSDDRGLIRLKLAAGLEFPFMFCKIKEMNAEKKRISTFEMEKMEKRLQEKRGIERPDHLALPHESKPAWVDPERIAPEVYTPWTSEPPWKDPEWVKLEGPASNSDGEGVETTPSIPVQSSTVNKDSKEKEVDAEEEPSPPSLEVMPKGKTSPVSVEREEEKSFPASPEVAPKEEPCSASPKKEEEVSFEIDPEEWRMSEGWGYDKEPEGWRMEEDSSPIRSQSETGLLHGVVNLKNTNQYIDESVLKEEEIKMEEEAEQAQQELEMQWRRECEKQKPFLPSSGDIAGLKSGQSEGAASPFVKPPEKEIEEGGEEPVENETKGGVLQTERIALVSQNVVSPIDGEVVSQIKDVASPLVKRVEEEVFAKGDGRKEEISPPQEEESEEEKEWKEKWEAVWKRPWQGALQTAWGEMEEVSLREEIFLPLGKRIDIEDVSMVEDRNERARRLWIRCEECGTILYRKHVKENAKVCFTCASHIEMSSKERIESLIDADSWRPINEYISPGDPLDFEDEKLYLNRLDESQERTGLMDAIQTGTAIIEEIPVALGVMDFQFMGGSMGSVVGEKITRLIEYALDEGLFLILACASGGARMQEGIFSLMQMAKISGALNIYKSCGHLLYISLLTSPTTGGVTASFAMLGDIIIAEPKAVIGFAGRRVIEQTLQEELPSNFQTAEYLHHHGLVDLIVHRHHLREAFGESFLFHQNAPLKEGNLLRVAASTNGVPIPPSLEGDWKNSISNSYGAGQIGGTKKALFELEKRSDEINSSSSSQERVDTIVFSEGVASPPEKQDVGVASPLVKSTEGEFVGYAEEEA